MRVPTLVGLAAAATLIGASVAPAAAGRLNPASMRTFGQHVVFPTQIVRTQVDPRHPNVLSRKGQIAARKYMASHPVHLTKRMGGPIKNFLMDDASYIWSVGKKDSVVDYHIDCSGAEGGKVDKTARLVVACTNSGDVNIYNSGNTGGSADLVYYENSSSCSGSYCNYYTYYPADAFEDNAGNVYATNLYGFLDQCQQFYPYYCYFYFLTGSVSEWNAGSPYGSYPNYNYTDPNLYEDYFGDVDANGNVYVDGFCYTQSCNYGFIPEVDQIANFLTTPTPSNLGLTLNFPGGIYVATPNKPGTVLSVLDQGNYGSGNGVLNEYALPTPLGPATFTTNPPQNLFNLCDPVAQGYNKKENKIAIGDAGCRAIDTLKKGNPWFQSLNANFQTPIDAAYLKSDK